MGGLCVVVNLDGEPAGRGLALAMAGASPHRGPDGTRGLEAGECSLAAQALCSTPESAGERQPLRLPEGELLVADARIDNRAELVASLRGTGHLEGASPSDVEIIAAAWRRWGEDCPRHLVGDYAFAVWDARRRELTCARDALGVRPLHYAVCGRALCVASEARQVLAHPRADRSLDRTALAEHLADCCVDETRTAFLSVRKVPPAHTLALREDRIRLQRYWDPVPHAFLRYRRAEEYVEHYTEIVGRAVRDRLRASGETVGILMSGGLDSTTVAAVAAREIAANALPVRLHALSYSFGGGSPCDESRLSGLAAERIGIPIDFVPAQGFPLLGDPVAYSPDPETPFLSDESLEREGFSRLAERGVRVVLTGHVCGSLAEDLELCGPLAQLLRGRFQVLRELKGLARRTGTGFWRAVYRRLLRPLVPVHLVEAARTLLTRPDGAIPPWLADSPEARASCRRRLHRSSAVWNVVGRRRTRERLRAGALGPVGRALYHLDRRCAAFGIEPRHPLLDRRLREFVNAVPPHRLGSALWNRPLVRRAMAGLLPGEVLFRRDKSVLTEWHAECLRGGAAGHVSRLLEDPLAAKIGLVHGPRLRAAWDRFLHHEREDWIEGLLWPAITLEPWLRAAELGPAGLRTSTSGPSVS